MSRIFKKNAFAKTHLQKIIFAIMQKNGAHEISRAPFVNQIESQALWAKSPSGEHYREILTVDTSVVVQVSSSS